MRTQPTPLRPALVAGCFALGALLAAGSAIARAMPLTWLAALVLALAVGRARSAGWLLAAVLAGGAAVALESQLAEPPPPVGDHRSPRELTGRVAVPIDDLPGGYRFNLVADRPAGLVVAVTVRGRLAAAPEPGDRVAVTGTLRDDRGYRGPGAAGRRAAALAARGASASMSVDAGAVDPLAGGSSLWRPAVRARRALSAAIAARGGDPEGNALARAMAIGDRGAVPRPVQDRFRDAGIAHLLAVSGLHLAAVTLLVFWITRRLWGALSPRLDPTAVAAVVALVAAVAYTLATGARTSTLRALLVAVVVTTGLATSRRARFVDALGLAAIALIACRPSIVLEPGFQLSFAATLVLALAVRPKVDDLSVEAPRWPRLRAAGRRLRELVGATAWATAATAPITAHAFGQLSIGGLATNLLAVPLCELVILPAALAGAVLEQLGAGGPLIDLAVAGAGAVDELAGAVATAAPAWRVPPPTTFELCAWAGGLAAALAWRRGALRPRRALAVIAAAGLAIAISFAATSWLRPALSDDLAVTFLDVGQGDAAVVELPGGGAWLIDAGGLPHVPAELPADERARIGALPGERAVVGYLHHRRIRRLDRVVISHPHPDHYRGLAAVAEAVAVDELWVAAGAVAGDPELAALVERLRRAGTRVVHPELDRPVATGDVQMTALAPRYLAPTAEVDPVVSVNDNSLVVRVERAGRSILFTGDLELEGEELLVDRYGRALAADVVKVAHHGSATSSTAGFVAATSPELAVISCGAGNRFGFPAPAVLRRWRAAGAAIRRTDRSGAVTVRLSASGEMTVATFDPP